MDKKYETIRIRKTYFKELKDKNQALETEVERVGQLNHCNLVGLGMKNKALEAENKKLREGIASIIRDSKNDGSYLIVPIRKLLELNQAPTGGGQ